MAITINGNGTITGISTGGLPSGSMALPSGSVIQTVQGEVSSTVTIDSTTDTTVCSASITPASTSNKVLVTVSAVPIVTGGSGQDLFKSKILRDSTVLQITNDFWARNSSSDMKSNVCTFVLLDSPSSTSSITYSFKAARRSADDDLSFLVVSNEWVKCHTITLQEIQG